MTDLKIFRMEGTEGSEILGSSMAMEKSRQRFIEENLQCLLGVRFLASEYVTGPKPISGR